MKLNDSQLVERFTTSSVFGFDDDKDGSAIDITKKSFASVIAEHRGENVWFTVTTYNRINAGENFFGAINAYIASLGQQAEDRIFQCYKDIKEASENFSGRRDRFNSVSEYVDYVKDVVARLFDEIDEDHFIDWIVRQHLVYVPAACSVTYTGREDSMHTRDKTYLRHEFIQLAALGYLMRMMIPIWGLFVMHTHKEYRVHKEFYAFRLLSRSKAFRYKAIIKLMQYIPLFMNDQRQIAAAVYSGISKDDYPEHMMAYYVVRKLAVADPLSQDENRTIITGLHSHISEKFALTNSNLVKNGSGLHVKNIGSDADTAANNASEEMQRSVLEHYTINECRSRGATQIGQTRIFNKPNGIEDTATRLEPAMPKELLWKFIECAFDNLSDAPAPIRVQELILFGTMVHDTAPSMIQAMEYKEVLQLIGLTAAVNWYRGNYLIAALQMAIVKPNEGVDQFVMTQTTRKGKYSREVKEKLRLYYPYEQVTGSARTRKNAGEVNVERFVGYISQPKWINTLPKSITEEAVSNYKLLISEYGEIIIPEDIRDIIAQYFFTIADAQARTRDVVQYLKQNREELLAKL